MSEERESSEDNMDEIKNIYLCMLIKVKKEEKNPYRDEYCAFIRKKWYNLPGAENCLPTDYKCIDSNYEWTVVDFAEFMYRFFFFNAENFQIYNLGVNGKYKFVWLKLIFIKLL